MRLLAVSCWLLASTTRVTSTTRATSSLPSDLSLLISNYGACLTLMMRHYQIIVTFA